MRHRANLDILRAFAVTAVLMDHLFLTVHSHLGVGSLALTYRMTALGHAGVLAFFVHTSLVLMYSLERMHKTTDKVTLPFYARRAFRIYPLAITAVVLALLFHIPYKTYDKLEPLTHAGIAANLLLVQNLWTHQQVLSPMWSLPYEVQMYIVLPGLFLVARSRRALVYLAGLLVAFWGLGTAIALATGHLNMAAYVPCFLSGVLCYALRDRVKAMAPATAWIPFLAVLIGGFVLANPNENTTFWSGWIYCLVLGLAINAFRDSRARGLNFFAEKTALYSYGMYLLHTAALYIVFLRLGVQSVALGTVLFFALTGLFAVAAFHAIESPFIEVGRRLSSPRGRRIVVDADTPAP